MKKMRRLCAGFLACAALCALGAAFAADPSVEDAQEMLELQAKWEALPQRQRKAVYKLLERKGDAEIALMEEYAVLGLISEAEAEAYEERVEDWLEAMEESGKMPPVFGRRKGAEKPVQPRNAVTE